MNVIKIGNRSFTVEHISELVLESGFRSTSGNWQSGLYAEDKPSDYLPSRRLLIYFGGYTYSLYDAEAEKFLEIFDSIVTLHE